MAAPTPMGAKYITRLVKENMVSVSDSQNFNMGARLASEHSCQGDSEEDCEHGNLQNLILGDRLRNVLGEDVQQKIIPAKRSRVLSAWPRRRSAKSRDLLLRD